MAITGKADRIDSVTGLTILLGDKLWTVSEYSRGRMRLQALPNYEVGPPFVAGATCEINGVNYRIQRVYRRSITLQISTPKPCIPSPSISSSESSSSTPS